MKRTESQENYLETILLLSKKKPVVRSVDIANELGFSKPGIFISHRQGFRLPRMSMNDIRFSLMP